MRPKPPGSKLLRWILGTLAFVVLALLGLMIFGLVREEIARNDYSAQYPPPGEMVAVNGHDIHLNCVGSGAPTIVFESDLDQYGSLSWRLIQDDIGSLTRTCSYDRAGIMWSAPGPRPRDGETIATELKAVLDQSGEKGPYLLVGHGFGGVYIRIFAGKYPDTVCGMVLLESGHPDMIARFEELGGNLEIPDKQIRPLIWLLSRLGSPGRFKGNPYSLPPEIHDPVQAFLPQSSLAWFDEKAESATTLDQARQYENLGDLPLIVLAAERAPSVENGQAYQEMWLDLQRDLLSLSGKSELRVDVIGHYPQIQAPDLTETAIRDILGQCR